MHGFLLHLFSQQQQQREKKVKQPERIISIDERHMREEETNSQAAERYFSILKTNERALGLVRFCTLLFLLGVDM